jgi:NAD(P)-dependent dehydrogenase (short-subunit alcohol dehydrogenase family)
MFSWQCSILLRNFALANSSLWTLHQVIDWPALADSAINPAMGRLNKRVVVIIGGTAGIGLSAAKAFIDEGAKVVALGRDRKDDARARAHLGKSAMVLVGDATNPATAKRAIARALKEFGGFHGLYHVAGGSGRRMGDGRLHEITNEGWEFTLRLNLASVFYSNRAATQQFLQQRSAGTILNVGSVLGFSPSPKFFCTHAYAAAKAAIVGLTRAAAACYAADNIRFNVLSPGSIATPMSQRAQENETIMKFLRSKQPLDGGRMGRPDDLDAAAVFFMSADSRFVTGQDLTVDGGWSVTEGQIP